MNINKTQFTSKKLLLYEVLIRIYIELHKYQNEGYLYMITWMQRHKKYLIVTIWISTIAFVLGTYASIDWTKLFKHNANTVAKVGNIEITRDELKKSYSRLYVEYSKMFQGNFDKEKAKSFGLEKQALKQLIDQALILNLAKSYDLTVRDEEVLAELKTQEYFFNEGVFDKGIYKEVLSKNNISTKEYESEIKKQLLIEKTLKLLPVESSTKESAIIDTVMNIADKIEYKVLSDKNINIDTSDDLLKPFWENKRNNFMTEVSYEVNYIKQTKVSQENNETKINEHYSQNKNHYKDEEGKIIPLEDAKDIVIAELNAKATKKMALKTYIDYKNDKLSADVKVETTTVSQSSNPFNEEVLEKLKNLSMISPYLKAVQINGVYYTFKLAKINQSVTKSFEDAKKEILPLYIENEKKVKLLALAEKSLETFKGVTTDFLTIRDADSLKNLSVVEASEFLSQLFNLDKKRGIIELNNGKVVIYNILAQKLLEKSNNNQSNLIARLKSTLFNEGLIKKLQNKYKTEIFIQGL